ncbi:hypothetical protein [Streptomyces sp. NPDC056463]|uniref:hypothetical protein n=1 Tax=Streptomyces sp. NPDC056463 TaxID=3345827 RepID=UPI0036C539AE
MAMQRVIRVTAEDPPATLEEVVSFFRDLNSIYGYAQYIVRCVSTSHEPTESEITEIWAHGYKEESPRVTRIATGSIVVEILKSPTELVNAVFLALINLATLPVQVRAKWHEHQYQAESFKAKRDSLRRNGNIVAEEVDSEHVV